MKHKTNLYAWLRGRVQKEQLETITRLEKENAAMALKMHELLPYIREIIADFNTAKKLISDLSGKIADMENERAAEVALMEEAKGMIAAARDSGGSTGGVVG
jgi:hypothetical protein